MKVFTIVYSVNGFCTQRPKGKPPRNVSADDAVRQLEAKGWEYDRIKIGAGPQGQDCLYFTKEEKGLD